MSLTTLDHLWEEATNVSRVGLLDVLEHDGQEIGICHVAVFLPFTFPSPEGRVAIGTGVTEGLVAVSLMAFQMLNEGDGSVIPRVQHLNDTCPIRFTFEVFDTAAVPSVAVNTLLEVIGRRQGERKICAILGPFRSSVSIPMAIIGGLQGIPQISPTAKSSQLDDKTQFPLFGRTSPSDEGDATAYLLRLKDTGVRHVGLIHWNDEFGNTFARVMLQKAAEIYPELVIVSVDLPAFVPSQSDYEEVVRVMKRTEFRWFYAVLVGGRDFAPLMTEAVKQGIAGTGKHVWQFQSTMGRSPLNTLVTEKDSPLAIATQGVGLIRDEGGLEGTSEHDLTHQKWKDLNTDEDIALANDKLPTYPDLPDDFVRFNLTPAVFEQATVHGGTATGAFWFDAHILLGLAACEAVSSPAAVGKRSTPLSLDGRALYDAMLNTTFSGSSGNVTLDPGTGTREPTSAVYTLYNYQTVPVNETHVAVYETDSAIFVNAKWNMKKPYIYNDRTANVPADLPDLQHNYNHIGTGLRTAGLSMAVLVLVLSLAFAAWTVHKRDQYVVRASQPIFLLILCGGTFIMGTAIIPLSIDDDIASTRGCDVACMAVPWLASTGFVIIFAALFSKTWRVNRIFNRSNMQRVKVTASDVILPLIIMLVLNLVVLTVWTVVSPLRWNRETIDVDVFNRPSESRGLCHADHVLAFVIIIVVFDVGALMVACYQSYLARGISTEFAETEYIGRAIACMLLVCFVGVPTIMIVSDEPRAQYFVLTCIIFVLCASVLLFIFVPKILFGRRNPGTTAFKNNMRAATRRRSTYGAGGTSSVTTGRNYDCYAAGSSSQQPSGRRGSSRLRLSILSKFQKSASLTFAHKEDDSREAPTTAETSQMEVSTNDADVADSGEGGIRIIDTQQMVSHLQSENQGLRDRVAELEILLASKDTSYHMEEENHAIETC